MKVAFSLKSTKLFENRILIDFLPKFILELLLFAGGSHFILFKCAFCSTFSHQIFHASYLVLAEDVSENSLCIFWGHLDRLETLLVSLLPELGGGGSRPLPVPFLLIVPHDSHSQTGSTRWKRCWRWQWRPCWPCWPSATEWRIAQMHRGGRALKHTGGANKHFLCWWWLRKG